MVLLLLHSIENRSTMFVLQSMVIPDVDSLTHCSYVLCITAEFGLFYQVLPNTGFVAKNNTLDKCGQIMLVVVGV